jgi:hypothetical protein
VSRHDPAAVRAWAAAHDIALSDLAEPANGTDPEPAQQCPVPEPVAQPRFTEYQRPGLARHAVVQSVLALEAEARRLEQRVSRLREQYAGALSAAQDAKSEVRSLRSEAARLKRQSQDLLLSNAGLKSRAERQAAEDAEAAALARRVAQILEGGREADPFTAALAALGQRRRYRGEPASDGDPQLAVLAGAIRDAARHRARVRQLQVRQIHVNKQHGPDSAEAQAVRRELAAARLAMAVLACMGTGLDSDDVISVVLTGLLPDRPGPPRLLTGPDWPVAG